MFTLFAASLQLVMGTGGMASFGHAAYFGLGAYAAALAAKHGIPMEAALLLSPLAAVAGALAIGWFCVRLSGVYMAMLTLAFAQIVWSIAFQWDDVTGGSNGIVGVWPATWLSEQGGLLLVRARLLAAGARGPRVDRARAARLFAARVPRFAAARRRHRHRRPRHAVDRRSRSPAASRASPGASRRSPKAAFRRRRSAIPRSVDALVMVLLGGLNALAGPLLGAAAFTWLADTLARVTILARVLGATILFIVIAFPMGIGGTIATMDGPAAANEPRNYVP